MARLKANLEAALERNAGDLGERMKALATGDEGEPEPASAPAEETPRSGPRNTAVSFTQEEYEFIKQIFEQKAKGMKVATGVKMAALYVAERLERGLISMSRAGISERR